MFQSSMSYTSTHFGVFIIDDCGKEALSMSFERSDDALKHGEASGRPFSIRPVIVCKG